SRSTAEAEYIVMAKWLSVMLWTRNLLQELKILKTNYMNVWCDNQSSINIAHAPMQHARIKHDAGIVKLSM
uniref:Reverse transcriptase Ty1/copia-type domain-containing protein n=1 Tax=Aegilops tauschii subsp. strangulata TaxID=200361 RepID=A0A453QIV0_AEGTS